jgi:uncharacterized membrane protein
MIQIIPNWHPMFVHFPIAFATAAVAFTVAGKLLKDRALAAQCLIMGRWMLWGAAITACVTAVFGWIASNSVLHDEAGRLAMTLHRNWAIGALVALVLLAAWVARTFRPIETPSNEYLILLSAVWLLLAIASWHGGEVVYRHGLGVMSLPFVDDGRGANPGGLMPYNPN